MLYQTPFPEIGEVVIATCEEIRKSSIKVRLEDFSGLEEDDFAYGMIHISELSSRWVRNVNSIISVGQRVVLIVIQVDEHKGYIDLSLRRVSKKQKKSKMGNWKHNQKLESLMKFFCDQNDMKLADFYEIALWPIINEYDDFRGAFETIKEKGIKELEALELDLSEDLIKKLFEIIQENVKIPKVNIVAEFELISYEGNGLDLIKETFGSIDELKRKKSVSHDIKYIGAPIYRIEVSAKNYTDAEKFLKSVQSTIEDKMEGNYYFDVSRTELSNAQ